MCDTRQHDGSIKIDQDNAITQVPLQDSAEKKGDCGQEDWRRIAKLAEVETDPDKLMDLAQQLVNELDRESATNALPTWNSSRDVNRTSEEGK